MGRVGAVVTARKEKLATFTVKVLEGCKLIPAKIVVFCAKSEGWHSDVLRDTAQANLIVVVVHIFIAIHFGINVLINVIEPGLVLRQSITQFFEVFLRHERFELWQLFFNDSSIKTHSNDPLVEAIVVFIEELMASFDTPRSRIEASSVNDCTRSLACMSKVEAQDVSSETDSICIHASASLTSLRVLNVFLVDVFKSEFTIFP